MSIVVAANRSGTTLTRMLPDAAAAAIRAHLEAAIEPGALFVTDGAPFFPPCARSLRLTYAPLDHKAGERRVSDRHLNTVNCRHERLKTFLRGRRAVALRAFAWAYGSVHGADVTILLVARPAIKQPR